MGPRGSKSYIDHIPRYDISKVRANLDNYYIDDIDKIISKEKDGSASSSASESYVSYESALTQEYYSINNKFENKQIKESLDKLLNSALASSSASESVLLESKSKSKLKSISASATSASASATTTTASATASSSTQ
jgi:hypothetical protein